MEIKDEVYFYVALKGKIYRATDFALYLNEWFRIQISFKVGNKYYYLDEDLDPFYIGFSKEEAKKECENIKDFYRKYNKIKRNNRK